MVDWSLARQVAALSAGADDPGAYDVDLTAICAELEGPVGEYTGLELGVPVPAPELVSRSEWASANLVSLAELLDPVAARLDDRLGFAGPLAGALRVGAAATVAAEAGLVMGYVSHRVLGQYDVSLLAGDRPARLLFVAPNLRRAVSDMGVERSAFERWICAHELTHVFQFQGVPWLREHMSSLVREYLESVEVRIDRGAAGGLPSIPSPSRLVERFREGGLAALIQTREQRSVMARLQAAMAVIEGHSEHVMDSLGERLIPDLANAARRDGPPSWHPLGAGARGGAAAGPGHEARPVQAGQVLLRRGGRARRHGRAGRRVERARRPPGSARAERSARLARTSRPARSGLDPSPFDVTSAPRRFTNVCSMVYSY